MRPFTSQSAKQSMSIRSRIMADALMFFLSRSARCLWCESDPLATLTRMLIASKWNLAPRAQCIVAWPPNDRRARRVCSCKMLVARSLSLAIASSGCRDVPGDCRLAVQEHQYDHETLRFHTLVFGSGKKLFKRCHHILAVVFGVVTGVGGE